MKKFFRTVIDALFVIALGFLVCMIILMLQGCPKSRPVGDGGFSGTAPGTPVPPPALVGDQAAFYQKQIDAMWAKRQDYLDGCRGKTEEPCTQATSDKIQDACNAAQRAFNMFKAGQNAASKAALEKALNDANAAFPAGSE